MEASLAVRENTPQRRDQPIEFEQRRRHINLQRLGGLEVDDELQLGRESVPAKEFEPAPTHGIDLRAPSMRWQRARRSIGPRQRSVPSAKRKPRRSGAVGRTYKARPPLMGHAGILMLGPYCRGHGQDAYVLCAQKISGAVRGGIERPCLLPLSQLHAQHSALLVTDESWRDFSFTSQTAARLRMRRGRTALASKPRGLMLLKLPASSGKTGAMKAKSGSRSTEATLQGPVLWRTVVDDHSALALHRRLHPMVG
jgi:hypothetical protein